jgi:hypothetical protein
MDGMITSRDVENFAGSKAGAAAAPVAPSFVMPPGNVVDFKSSYKSYKCLLLYDSKFDNLGEVNRLFINF